MNFIERNLQILGVFLLTAIALAMSYPTAAVFILLVGISTKFDE